MQNQGC